MIRNVSPPCPPKQREVYHGPYSESFCLSHQRGGFESLIIPFDCKDYRTATHWNPEGLTVRLQIGLEDVEDLKQDLAEGLTRLRKAV